MKPWSYPNIEAIAAGTISGAFREWPKVQPEAKALLAEVDAAVAELQKYPGHHPGLGLAENVRELVRDLAASEAEREMLHQSLVASNKGVTTRDDSLRAMEALASAEAKRGDRLRADLDAAVKHDHEVHLAFNAERERTERLQAEVQALREALLRRGVSAAPCDICGYNGPGYYQPETHGCVAGPIFRARALAQKARP